LEYQQIIKNGPFFQFPKNFDFEEKKKGGTARIAEEEDLDSGFSPKESKKTRRLKTQKSCEKMITRNTPKTSRHNHSISEFSNLAPPNMGIVLPHVCLSSSCSCTLKK
jgi:hypothetical protein